MSPSSRRRARTAPAVRWPNSASKMAARASCRPSRSGPCSPATWRSEPGRPSADRCRRPQPLAAAPASSPGTMSSWGGASRPAASPRPRRSPRQRGRHLRSRRPLRDGARVQCGRLAQRRGAVRALGDECGRDALRDARPGRQRRDLHGVADHAAPGAAMGDEHGAVDAQQGRAAQLLVVEACPDAADARAHEEVADGTPGRPLELACAACRT